MKLGATISLLVAIALAWAGMAHDHPPPISCISWCEDDNCQCWEKCKASGLTPPNDCTVQCNAVYEDCEKSCNGSGS